jgi:hypothetical protein
MIGMRSIGAHLIAYLIRSPKLQDSASAIRKVSCLNVPVEVTVCAVFASVLVSHFAEILLKARALRQISRIRGSRPLKWS